MKTKIPDKFPPDSIKELSAYGEALSHIKGTTLELGALGTIIGLILNKGEHYQLACMCLLIFGLMDLARKLLDFYGTKTTKQEPKEKTSPRTQFSR